MKKLRQWNLERSTEMTSDFMLFSSSVFCLVVFGIANSMTGSLLVSLTSGLATFFASELNLKIRNFCIFYWKEKSQILNNNHICHWLFWSPLVSTSMSSTAIESINNSDLRLYTFLHKLTLVVSIASWIFFLMQKHNNI